MANTKKLDRKERRLAKRQARRTLKAKLGSLSHADRKALRKFEGTKTAFFRQKEAAAKAAAEQAAAPPASE
ncbi:MAG TPA: hypothetical protein PKX48_00475 [Planctomycetota bacterium]|jgi:hypothetical protein|nr:hypothetical protein [Planctomycetota bacterium]OQC20353.1 MAG: hypothetical protein BWX69_01850 [Planctomycetes bacterium ADurb.Bin069]NMD34428.1 hypothetical protein [Planctomycetota bacterium]HNR98662.1 hypothetical protein [Planctomycetota bacterium]HNU25042.1 hypothetical protein [Planctomycetota bacterium]